MAERIFLVSKGNYGLYGIGIREAIPSIPGNLDSEWLEMDHGHLIDKCSFKTSGEGLGMGHEMIDSCVIKYGKEITPEERREFMVGFMEGRLGSNVFWNGEKYISVREYVTGGLQNKPQGV